MAKQSDDEHPLEQAILECLESEDVETALASLRERLPEHSDQIRRITKRLSGLGVFTSTDDQGDLRTLGPFQIRERLGEGGMGVVYRAWQDPPGREVALKIIRPELLHFDGTRARFKREVEASVKLSHPGIVPVFEVGSTDGVPWFSMAFVRGESLSAVISAFSDRSVDSLLGADLKAMLATSATSKPGSGTSHSSGEGAFISGWVDSCLHIVQGIASALTHAHLRGVMHRDIKPSNIILSVGGHALLLDFGLAHTENSQRITQSQGVLGSLPYMPPEMLHGHVTSPNPSLDIYALGVTLYELLTLRNPFVGPTPEATRRNIFEARPEPPRRLNSRISKDLQTVCMTAMAEEPHRRYASIADFAHDLENVSKGDAISASPDTAPQRAARFMRRNRLLVTTTITVFVLLAAGIATTLRMSIEAERLRKTAEWTGYRATIGGAELSLKVHSVQNAIEALRSTKSESRSWEWRHLLSRIDLSEAIALSRSHPMTKLTAHGHYIAVATSTSVIVLDRDSTQLVREVPATGIRSLALVGEYVVWTSGDYLYATGAKTGLVRVFGKGKWSSIAASPDGSKLVTVSRSGDVSIWRIDDNRRLAHYRSRSDRLNAVDISSDRVACAGESGLIYFLDHSLTQTLSTIRGRSGVIDKLAFTRDGSRLASVSRNSTVHLWSVETGERIGFPLQHNERVRALAFHPTRSELFTAADQAIYRWSIRTGMRLGVVHGHRSQVSDLAWQTPQGPILSVSDDGTLRRWNPAAQDIQCIQAQGRAVMGLAVFPDGKHVVSIARGEAGRVRNTETEEVVFDSMTESLFRGVGTYVDARGESLALLSMGHLHMLRVNDWSQRWLKPAEGGEFRTAAFSHDGRILATGGTGILTVALWDTETGSRIERQFPALDGTVSSIAFTKDGRRIVIAGTEGIGVRILDAIDGTEITCLSMTENDAIALDKDDRLIASGGAHGVRVWQMDDFAEAYQHSPHAVHDLAFDPQSDRLLTGGRDGVVRVFRGGVEVMHLGSVGAPIRAVEFSADGTTFVTGDNLGKLRILPAVAVANVPARLAQLHAESEAMPLNTLHPNQAANPVGEPGPSLLEFEAESLGYHAKSTGKLTTQSKKLWSGGQQTWWRRAKAGDILCIHVPLPEPGQYSISARLTKSFDYAVVKLSFNGKPLSDRLDLRSKKTIVASEALGEVSAHRGMNKLRVELIATSRPLRPSKFPGGFGLDRLVLTRID